MLRGSSVAVVMWWSGIWRRVKNVGMIYQRTDGVALTLAPRACDEHGGDVSGVGWYARMRGRRCGCMRGFAVCGRVWR